MGAIAQGRMVLEAISWGVIVQGGIILEPNILLSTLFICFVLDGLLQSIWFWMFCSKHSISFEKPTKLLISLCLYILHQIKILCNFHSNKLNDQNLTDWNIA